MQPYDEFYSELKNFLKGYSNLPINDTIEAVMKKMVIAMLIMNKEKIKT